MQRNVTVLGSTGSIGKQALDVVAGDGAAFRLLGIAAHSNAEMLIAQAQAYHPQFVAFDGALDASRLPEGTLLFTGPDAAVRLASLAEADVVVNGISGIAALEPLLAALNAGKRVALANKESIVCGKVLVNAACRQHGGEVLTVDSEQSAILQCLKGGARGEVQRLILTASGGPFWKRRMEELSGITVEEALCHPTWNMGKKITIDSATLFNKGLEVIEASYLFDVPGDRIDVLIHPQSIVHSMVEFCDGTVLANLSCPDMRLPIQYAMTYPARLPSPCRRLSLAEVGALTFFPAEPERYPALRLAYDALRLGGTATTVYNGANEEAVALYLNGRIGFTDIYRAVAHALKAHTTVPADRLETILAADAWARKSVRALFLNE